MLQTEQTQDVLVVKPRRDIVASYLDEFRQELKALIDAGNKNLAIDLEGVSIIDSKGLAVFMLCHKSLSAGGGALTVVTDSADFKHLFHIMRLDEQFRVTDAL